MELLERPFGELFLSNSSLRDQHRFIAFEIFSCIILIIFCTIEPYYSCTNKTNELTVYEILRRNVTIFYLQGLSSSFQVQVK